MNKINILFVLKWLPYPLTDGGRQAIFNGILAVKDFTNVHITYYDTYENKNSNLLKSKFREECKGVQLHPFNSKHYKRKICKYKFLKTIFNCFRSRYFANDLDKMIEDILPVNHYPNEYLEFVNELIKENSIQIVQVEMMATLPIVLNLPNHVKKIFVHHELAYVRNELLFKNTYLDFYQKNLFDMAKIIEVGLINNYDAVVTLSETDAKKLKESGVMIPIYSSFAIVSSETTMPKRADFRPILSFIGPNSHEPNVLGLTWFLENCWEELLHKDDSYKLRIIGRWTTEGQKKIMEKFRNVEFLGFVDDLSLAIANTTLIVPITIGSGIRMKIQEAALNGVPFITTKIGVEGLPFQDGVNCFIEDDPIKFVEKIIVLKDEDLRMKFIQSAYNLIHSSFSLVALQENRMHIINNIVKK